MVLTKIARQRILPSLRELMKETRGSTLPGMYVSNTRDAISPPCMQTKRREKRGYHNTQYDTLFIIHYI
jgi:hypothetical protein